MSRKVKRWMRKPNVLRVSLCPQPRNRFRGVYKSASCTAVEMPSYVRADSEKGELMVLALAPNQADIDGDGVSPEDIQTAMISWADNGYRTDLDHDGKDLERKDITPFEIFQVQKGDVRFEGMKDMDGASVDPTGAWAINYKIKDPALRAKVRDREWTGASIDALVEFEPEPVQLPEPVPVSKSTYEEPPRSTTMDETKLAALFAEALKPLLAGVEAVQKSLTEAPATPTTPPDEKFDPLNPRHVRQRIRALTQERVAKSLDLTSLEDLVNHYKHLEEQGLVDGSADSGDGMDLEAEARRILGLGSSSNQVRKSSRIRIADHTGADTQWGNDHDDISSDDIKDMVSYANGQPALGLGASDPVIGSKAM